MNDSNELGFDLYKAAAEARAIAHRPEAFVRIDDGESVYTKVVSGLKALDGSVVPDFPLIDRVRTVLKRADFQHSIVYVYSVDIVKGVPQRHLSIQTSVPDKIERADWNLSRDALLANLEPQVAVYLPLATEVRFAMVPEDPRPVVDPEGKRPVHYRTPITFHFVTPHVVEQATPQIFGANGLPVPRPNARCSSCGESLDYGVCSCVAGPT